MKSLWVLIVREFTVRMAKRGFWVFTLFTMLIMVALTFMPTIQHNVERKSMTAIVVNDPGKSIAAQVQRLAAGNFSFAVSVAHEQGLLAFNQVEMSRFMKDHHTRLVVNVMQSEDGKTEFTVDENGSFDNETMSSLQELLRAGVTQTRMMELSPNVLNQLNAPVSFSTRQWQANAKSGTNFTESKMLVYFLVILLFTSLVSYGTWVAQGVIEEKSNRIVEMMLITVKPWQILFGKVIGIGLAGTSQCMLLLTVMMVSVRLQHQGYAASFQDVSPEAIFYFPIFFVLGYFMYATLFGISGSLVHRAEEQQMAVTPVTMLLLVFFYSSLFGLSNPSSTFTTILSFIPLEPMAMFSRIALTTVPAWQIGLGLIEDILLIGILVLLGARIYRKFALHTIGKSGFGVLFSRRNQISCEGKTEPKEYDIC